MKKRVVLFAIAIALIAVAREAYSRSLYDYETRARVLKSAASNTVKIIGPSDSGSGVIVDRKKDLYTVLTAGHVINSTSVEEGPQVMTPDGKKHLIVQIRKGSCLDLSEIVFASSDSYSVAKVRKAPVSIGEPFVVLGFTERKYTVSHDREQIGISGSDPTDAIGGYTLVYPLINSRVGWSGGGLFDGNGELFGIHGKAQTRYYAWEGLPLVPKMGPGQGNVKFGIPITYWKSVGLSECPTPVTFKDAESKALRLLIKGLHAVSMGKYPEAKKMFNEGKGIHAYPWFDFALNSLDNDLGRPAKRDQIWDRYYRGVSVTWTWPNDRNSQHCPYMRDFPVYAEDYSRMYGSLFVNQDMERAREWLSRNCK